MNRVQGERVAIPEFEIVAVPQIKLRDIKIRNFSIMRCYDGVSIEEVNNFWDDLQGKMEQK